MIDEGLCVEASPDVAVKFFERASALGDLQGSLEYAATVGMGRGAEQSYERAGQICRAPASIRKTG